VLNATPTPVAVSSRDRSIIWACIALITVLAWAYLLHLDRAMSSSMAHDRMMAEMGMTMDMPRTSADVFFTFAMWAVMMIGMMAGPATPTLLLFAGMQRTRASGSVPMALPSFGLGYLAVWTGFSACAAVAQEALHRAALLSPAMAASSPRVAGAILIAAGAYQLSPFKGACLTSCRSPLGFLMSRWRDGALGAFRMGLSHGFYCLGCCWALMCVLFAVGVMNLLWVAGLTAVVLLEKVGPLGAVVARATGVIMILGGIWWL
jgi:predicted metal-binding membrane protein